MIPGSINIRFNRNTKNFSGGVQGKTQEGEDITVGFFVFCFLFFLRKISPELTSAANPPLFAEEDWP